MTLLFPLLLATAPISSDQDMPQRGGVQVGTVSVEIIRAERVTVREWPQAYRATDRQYRTRDHMPMIEFY